MWWDFLKWNTVVIYSVLGITLGYFCRCFYVPRILKRYDLQANAWHWRYPLFECVIVFCSVLVALEYDSIDLSSLAVLVLTWGLLLLAFIDAEHFILPDVIMVPLWGLGVLVSIFEEPFVTLYEALKGSILGYSSLRLLSEIYYQATGRIGLGRGDIKLFSLLGAWFGCIALPLILWIAALSGLVWAAINLYLKKHIYNTPIPFGPFLAWGAGCYLMIIRYLLDSVPGIY